MLWQTNFEYFQTRNWYLKLSKPVTLAKLLIIQREPHPDRARLFIHSNHDDV